MIESGPEHIARLAREEAERNAPPQPKVRVDVDTVPEQRAQEDAAKAKKDARNAKRRETAKAKKEQGK